MSNTEIQPVGADQARRMLRLTLASYGQSSAELERHISAFLQYARAMSLDLSRHWTCAVDGRTVTGCTFIETVGRSAMLLLPDGDTTDCPVETTSHLLRQVLADVSDRNVRLVQCLIKPGDALSREALTLAGFREIALLRYMEWTATTEDSRGERGAQDLGNDPAVQWSTYDDACHDEFARLISATYQDSLDCPGLTGLRDIDDVIAGHKAAGRFDPHHWLLARRDGRAVGCLLFGENPLVPSLELAYMGVHPHCRRMGIGRRLLERGLALARRENFSNVTLAVDSENASAVSLYESAGFPETTRRRAMIHVVPKSC